MDRMVSEMSFGRWRKDAEWRKAEECVMGLKALGQRSTSVVIWEYECH